MLASRKASNPLYRVVPVHCQPVSLIIMRSVKLREHMYDVMLCVEEEEG